MPATTPGGSLSQQRVQRARQEPFGDRTGVLHGDLPLTVDDERLGHPEESVRDCGFLAGIVHRRICLATATVDPANAVGRRVVVENTDELNVPAGVLPRHTERAAHAPRCTGRTTMPRS